MNALKHTLVLGTLATALLAASAATSQAHPIIHPYIYNPYIYHPYPTPIYYSAVVRPVTIIDVSNPAPLADIRVVNPAGNAVAIRYRLNDGAARALPPGNVAHIRQQVVIEFDRGGAAGVARYSLIDGTYKFVASGGQWNLVRETAPLAPVVMQLER